MRDPNQLPPMVTHADIPDEATLIRDFREGDQNATYSRIQDADRGQMHEIGAHTFQYRGPDLPAPAELAGWYYWKTGAGALTARTLGPSKTLKEAVEFADWTIREEGLREEAREFEGMRLEYLDHDANDPVTGESGWYYGPTEESVCEFGPFEDYDAACADITDRPLRGTTQGVGAFTFGHFEIGDASPAEQGGKATIEGWTYWRTDVPGAGSAGRFATFSEALADLNNLSQAMTGVSFVDPTDRPPEVVGPCGSFTKADRPGPTDNFPPVLATLINEFDWRHHSEHLQKITRPFAALAFALARTDPHPFWTEKAMLALVYARYLAMKAWAYTEDRGESAREAKG